MQIGELGTIESPIALTSTLNTWRIADYMIDYLQELNPEVHSFNPMVAECNDWFLNEREIKTKKLRSDLWKKYKSDKKNGV